MIINRITKQGIKDILKVQKQLLQAYKKDNSIIPQKWSINEQRAYIQGIEALLRYIIQEEKNENK